MPKVWVFFSGRMSRSACYSSQLMDMKRCETLFKGAACRRPKFLYLRSPIPSPHEHTTPAASVLRTLGTCDWLALSVGRCGALNIKTGLPVKKALRPVRNNVYAHARTLDQRTAPCFAQRSVSTFHCLCSSAASSARSCDALVLDKRSACGRVREPIRPQLSL